MATPEFPSNSFLALTKLTKDEALILANRVAQMPIEALGRVKWLMNDFYHNTLTEQLLAERQQIAMSPNSKVEKD